MKKVYEKAINVKLRVNQEKSDNNSNEKVLRYIFLYPKHNNLSLTYDGTNKKLSFAFLVI